MEHRLSPFVVETQLIYYPLPQLPANGAANVLHRRYIMCGLIIYSIRYWI